MELQNQLKIACGLEITSSNLKSSDKLHLLSFVENANEHQLKYFLVHNKQINKALTENQKELIDKEFEYHKRLVEDVMAPIGVICGMSVFTPGIWNSWRQLKGAMIQRNLQCKNSPNTRQKHLCVDYSKIIFFKKQIFLINQVIRMDCPKTQNPNNCVRKGQGALQATTNKLQRLLNRSHRTQDQGLYNF
jgi:hypothetical protein